MIEREDAERAAQFLLDSAREIAIARGDMEAAEKMIGHTLAVAASMSDATSEAARDREAKASSEYRTAIAKWRDAVVEFQKLKSLREAAEARIGIYQTNSANERGFQKGASATR